MTDHDMHRGGGGSNPTAETLLVRYPQSVTCGRFMQMEALNIERAHSLTLEFYGPNGGIFRYFPRQRQKMPLVFRLNQPGATTFFLTARDEMLQTIAVRSGQVIGVDANISQNAASGDVTEMRARNVHPAPVLMATDKPPMAETDQTVSATSPMQSAAPKDLAQSLQERIESRLLGRFEKP